LRRENKKRGEEKQLRREEKEIKKRILMFFT
jgi:hypothetical protein